jgi:hypothetical protein
MAFADGLITPWVVEIPDHSRLRAIPGQREGDWYCLYDAPSSSNICLESHPPLDNRPEMTDTDTEQAAQQSANPLP